MFTLTIDRSVLAEEIHYLKQVLDKKPISVVLSNYLFKLIFNESTHAYELYLIATDLDLYIKSRVTEFLTDFNDKEISFLVPAKQISDIVTKLPDCEMKFSLVGVGEHLQVKALRSKFNILTQSATDFVKEPDDYNESYTSADQEIKIIDLELPTKILSEMCARVLPSFSSDEEKNPNFNLSGVKFDIIQQKDLDNPDNIKKQLSLVFAVGTKLHYATSKLNDFDILTKESFNCLLPRIAIKFLSDLCNTDIDVIKIRYATNFMFFTVGNKTFITRTLLGQFPNYLGMVAYKHKNEIKLNRINFKNCIETTLAINDERQQTIRLFNAKSNSLYLSSTARLGNSEDIYQADNLEIAGLEVQFNFHYQNIEHFLRTEKTDILHLGFDLDSQLEKDETGKIIFKPVAMLKLSAIYDGFESHCLFNRVR